MGTTKIALAVGLAVAALGGCAGPGAGEPAWLYGTNEPVYGKEDGNAPLTIYLTHMQTDIQKTLPVESMGDLSRDDTGILNLDGRSFSDRTVLIFSGKLHAYDGTVEDHLFVLKPTWVPATAGSANPDGFLELDFKDPSKKHVVVQSGTAFGDTAGVFRGDVIATDAIGLGDDVASDVYSYAIQPQRLGDRPSNLLRGVSLYIKPNAALTTLAPAVGCNGDDVIDRTTAGTSLQTAVTLDGFPAGHDVVVELHYTVPHYAASNAIAHLWDYVTAPLSADSDETVASKTVHIADGQPTETVEFDPYDTLEPPWGTNLYSMNIEVRAYDASGAGAAADAQSHQLDVVEAGQLVMVDQFDLCPLDDVGCHAARDTYAPDNVVARRNVVEWEAKRKGLYDTITKPISECAGGDRIEGNFANACTAYREQNDSQLSYNISAELNFQLTVDGHAGGSASWSGSYGNLASADIAAQFKAAFHLNANLTASFDQSQVWLSHSSLDVLYDPARTQIEWWRVVTPRLRYMMLADFDACGVARSQHKVFLSDLRQSRLVLACEAVPSYDSVCYAVEPTDASVSACDTQLIDANSPEGQMCLAAPSTPAGGASGSGSSGSGSSGSGSSGSSP